MLSGTSGDILYNNSGKLGQYGISGTGNVAMTTGSAIGLTNATGATGANFGTQTANYFFAAPNGSAGNPIFRAVAGCRFAVYLGARGFADC